jgi:hypothetical protein
MTRFLHLPGPGGPSAGMAGDQSGGYDQVVDALDGARDQQAALSGLTEATLRARDAGSG